MILSPVGADGLFTGPSILKMVPPWLTRYSSPSASTPNELMLPSTAEPPSSAVCSRRSDALASPALSIVSASDQIRRET